MSIVRVIDFETTGLEPPDAEVCEFGFVDVDTDARTVTGAVSALCGVKAMPPEVRAVHHISLAETASLSPFSADSVTSPFVTAYAAHNAEFEGKFYDFPKPVICTYKAALRVWPDAPSHSNGALRYWLEDQGKINLDHALTLPPHRAGPDAYVTGHLLLALLATGTTGREMAAWTLEPRLLTKCPIGKFKGKPWAEVEAGFLGWMMRQPDMEHDLKWNAEREIARRNTGA